MTRYNRIEFSHIWDKLQDPEFTTIRTWNQGKEDYYRAHIGEKFTVLKVEHFYQYKPGNLICHAYLKGVILLDPRQLSTDLIRKDVSLEGKINQEWFDRISKMEKALLLVFSKNPVPVQKSLDVQPRDPLSDGSYIDNTGIHEKEAEEQ